MIVRTESVKDRMAASTVPCRKKVVNKKLLNLNVSSHMRAGVSFLSVGGASLFKGFVNLTSSSAVCCSSQHISQPSGE